MESSGASLRKLIVPPGEVFADLPEEGFIIGFQEGFFICSQERVFVGTLHKNPEIKSNMF